MAAARARGPEPDQALAAARDIAEDGEREIVLADLATIPGQPRYWLAHEALRPADGYRSQQHIAADLDDGRAGPGRAVQLR